MERIGILINKLSEQYQDGAEYNKLLITAQMLVTELQQNHKQGVAGGSQKIVVVMPSLSASLMDTFFEDSAKNGRGHIRDNLDTLIETPGAMTVEQDPAPTEENIPNELTAYNPEEDKEQLSQTEEENITAQVEPEPQSSPYTVNNITSFLNGHSSINAIPLQNESRLQPIVNDPIFELNDIMATNNESLNEKLREDKNEISSLLQVTPVKDLKKAIGVNDRFLFINELFRGDDIMYERSIKTINSFSILAEAQYWIERELKVKLGWKEDSEVVVHFNQLVKRRFS